MAHEGSASRTSPWTAVVLAAGKGTRMRSPLPKVLHPLAGRPLLWHVLRTLRDAGAHRIIVVTGYGADQVEAAFRSEKDVAFVRQEPQLGTGHAVMQAVPLLSEADDTVLVACGDMPLLRAETLRRLVDDYRSAHALAGVLTARVPNAGSYGRIVRDADGAFQGIVEAKDARPDQQAITEINTGTYCFRVPQLIESLQHLRPDNAQGEYYLTDVPGMLAQRGAVTTTFVTDDAEWQGINNQRDLAAADAQLQRRIHALWAEAGVVIPQPETVRIEADVRLAPGAVVGPMAVLRGATVVGEGARIGPFTELVDCRIGPGARVQGVELHRCILEANASVGPGVALEPGTVVASGATVGRQERRAAADGHADGGA